MPQCLAGVVIIVSIYVDDLVDKVTPDEEEIVFLRLKHHLPDLIFILAVCTHSEVIEHKTKNEFSCEN